MEAVFQQLGGAVQTLEARLSEAAGELTNIHVNLDIADQRVQQEKAELEKRLTEELQRMSAATEAVQQDGKLRVDSLQERTARKV